MASKVGLTWTSDTLTASFDHADKKGMQYLARMSAYYSLRGETFAKSKASWTDRTGNARSGLTGEYSARIGSTSATFEIDISHRVKYGIWLEVRFNQKYAIINKTVEKTGKDFFKAANNMFANMFGGS